MTLVCSFLWPLQCSLSVKPTPSFQWWQCELGNNTGFGEHHEEWAGCQWLQELLRGLDKLCPREMFYTKWQHPDWLRLPVTYPFSPLLSYYWNPCLPGNVSCLKQQNQTTVPLELSVIGVGRTSDKLMFGISRRGYVPFCSALSPFCFPAVWNIVIKLKL